jgi:hypothetical protein
VKVVIHQPDFLPYLGFFHRLLYCDEFLVLDNVQFVKGSKESWQHRDKIKGPQGEAWITVGVESPKFGSKINEVKLRDDLAWRLRILQQIDQYYRGSEYLKELFPILEKIINFPSISLSEFNWHSIEVLMDLFQIKVPIRWASQMQAQGKNNDLVVNLLKEVGANEYLSGVGARSYFKAEPFDNAVIKVYWQEFRPLRYRQLHGEFIPYLSSIDLLLNVGIENSRKLLRECGEFRSDAGETLICKR